MNEFAFLADAGRQEATDLDLVQLSVTSGRNAVHPTLRQPRQPRPRAGGGRWVDGYRDFGTVNFER